MGADFVKIKELRAELNKLLEERPEYKPFQAEIDEALKKAGNSHNRMAYLHRRMRENLLKLHEAFTDIGRLCKGEPTIDQEVKQILDRRVFIRCTGLKECPNRKGVGVSPKFAQTYLDGILDCQICGGKYAPALKEVKDEETDS